MFFDRMPKLHAPVVGLLLGVGCSVLLASCSDGASDDDGNVAGVAGHAGGGDSGDGGAGMDPVAGAGGGTSDSDCYSPTQNAPRAYDEGAEGCACANSAPVCVTVVRSGQDWDIALVCEDGHWQSVEDGPCLIAPVYSPDACREAGGSPWPSDEPDYFTSDGRCRSGARLGIIDADTSGWPDGGVCCGAGESCGGFPAFQTCSDDEYCAYEEGLACGAADAHAFCRPRPDGCNDLDADAPVCGCNQKPYASACAAAEDGTGVFPAGECSP